MSVPLLVERATAEWLRGEVIQVLARAAELDRSRLKVAGLDDHGHPIGRGERAANSVIDAWVGAGSGGGYVAVRGDDPSCAAVGLYRAVRHEHAWFVGTAHRVAVLRLRDLASGQEGAERELVEQATEGSLGGALRGLGRFVKASATELAKSVRRPPLHERPADARLACEFEVPRQELASIERWRQPLVPELRGGPRFVQVRFTDRSWARIKTDEAGQAALTN